MATISTASSCEFLYGAFLSTFLDRELFGSTCFYCKLGCTCLQVAYAACINRECKFLGRTFIGNMCLSRKSIGSRFLDGGPSFRTDD